MIRLEFHKKKGPLLQARLSPAKGEKSGKKKAIPGARKGGFLERSAETRKKGEAYT